MRTLFSVLLLTVMLSACGQKGPLYMPDKPAAHPASSPAPAKAPAKDESVKP
ncbi:LPS translocon maturation chaperone LptM [Undibacterium luofuense]|uniref:Lipoprotein n=1 Tax=Undibacterium luofuense TaxID=2828733 RepID=A0A941I5I1_9BURK|nr:lipoprotein [Undibacterium luofuense]MBR7780864.1 lipoprotein [Undibacterium luofuense]